MSLSTMEKWAEGKKGAPRRRFEQWGAGVGSMDLGGKESKGEEERCKAGWRQASSK